MFLQCRCLLFSFLSTHSFVCRMWRDSFKRMAGGLFGVDICAAILLAACLLYRWRRHYEDVFVCVVTSTRCCGSKIRCFLTPGSGMGKVPDPGFALNIPGHISKSLVTISWVKKAIILSCGFGLGFRCLFDPGFKMENLGTGINISPHFSRPNGQNV